MPLPRLLRGTLTSRPVPGGPTGTFVLPCRKLVFEYCERWQSSKGTRDFLTSEVVSLAQSNPSVEIVVRQRPGKHPVVRGFYRE